MIGTPGQTAATLKRGHGFILKDYYCPFKSNNCESAPAVRAARAALKQALASKKNKQVCGVYLLYKGGRDLLDMAQVT